MIRLQRPLKRSDKWQFVFTHGRLVWRMESGWHHVMIGFIKLRPDELRREGVRLSRRDYKGLLISFSYWFPIEVGL
jgi:hypothetical protein